ncbi:MAG: hypothetical protein JSW66_09090 [Phycisphaerales bacterium]|nr:MAG: hypothetical protein JSW66_09090 [Phycisphaerales bacterium]
MKDNRDNPPGNDDSTPLGQNIARLLKAAGTSSRPGAKFTESLVSRALDELKQSRGSAGDKPYGQARFTRLEKSLGWAAMVAAACSAGLAIMASMFLKVNFVLQSVIAIVMIFNWFTTIGEYIR